MRIIAGSHKNRTIVTPSDMAIRPTTDRAREGLFNVLQNEIEGSVFLDLFAGTGAIGFEALSRGAQKVDSVDSAKESINLLKRNSSSIGLELNIHQVDAIKFLQCSTTNYDHIFIDPPYTFTFEQLVEMLELILENNLIKDDGLVIVETSRRVKNIQVNGYSLYKEKKYGKSIIYFFERENDEKNSIPR
ncbi:MAG: 16S rRNA (guanine(966)-N(2))-methyltransferase RsmD [Mycoplasmatales bacterium]